MGKKIFAVVIVVWVIINMVGNFALATELNLIENVKISLKSAETPNRLEVGFDLTEELDLSQGEADIIFEYFTMNDNGEIGRASCRERV